MGKRYWIDEVDRMIHCEMRISEVTHSIIRTPQIRDNGRSRKDELLDDREQSGSVPSIHRYHETGVAMPGGGGAGGALAPPPPSLFP